MSQLSIPLSEVAAMLGVHYMTAYRYVRLGQLAATQERGRWVVAADELERFRQRKRATSGRKPSGTSRVVSADVVAQFESRLIDGDEPGAWRIAEDLLATGCDRPTVYLGLVVPAMRAIGDKWAAGAIGVAQEHLASGVVSRVIARLGAGPSPRGRRKGTAVLSAPPGEHHGLPTAIVADLLRLAGFHVVDLGADCPASEIAAAAAAHDRVIGVGICATTLDDTTRSSIADVVRLVHEHTGRPVLIGGAAIPSARHARALGGDGWSANAAEAVDWFEQQART